MFFCPFCGTLLLVQVCDMANKLCCSTCRYVHHVNDDSVPLTITHSFAEANKTLVDDDVDDKLPMWLQSVANKMSHDVNTRVGNNVYGRPSEQIESETTSHKTKSIRNESVAVDVVYHKEHENKGNAAKVNNGNEEDEDEEENILANSNDGEVGQITTIPCQNEEIICNSRKAYYVQVQMRSADEPATVFYQCVKCGFRWRQD